jgi:hypothetical protein
MSLYSSVIADSAGPIMARPCADTCAIMAFMAPASSHGRGGRGLFFSHCFLVSTLPPQRKTHTHFLDTSVNNRRLFQFLCAQQHLGSLPRGYTPLPAKSSRKSSRRQRDCFVFHDRSQKMNENDSQPYIYLVKQTRLAGPSACCFDLETSYSKDLGSGAEQTSAGY